MQDSTLEKISNVSENVDENPEQKILLEETADLLSKSTSATTDIPSGWIYFASYLRKQYIHSFIEVNN